MERLSVIIINYNAVGDILNCLRSCFQFPSASAIEWIVVNNDPDQSGKMQITSRYPSVKWIDMGYNSGFARANNKGIKSSSGNVVLLLNPDTIINDDSVFKCYNRLCNSDYVAASVQLLNEDGTPQITGNFIIKGGLNHLLPLPFLGPLLRKIAFATGTKKTNVTVTAAEEKVDWINGAFLMVKREAIEKAGLMDEDFFLYAEEAEWCSRLKKFGDMCVFGDLFTTHLQGESINRATHQMNKGYGDLTGKRGLQLMVSQHLRIRKQFGKGWFLVHLLMHTFEIPVFFLCSFIANIFRLNNPVSDWPKALSFTNNVLVLWKLSPKIWKNKPYFYKMFG